MPEICVIQGIHVIIISTRIRNAQNKTLVKVGNIKCILIWKTNAFEKKTVYLLLRVAVFPVFIHNLLSFIT